MKSVPLFNKSALVLGLCALVLNLIFFALSYHSKYYAGYRILFGEIAYNFYAFNELKVNTARENVTNIWAHEGQMVEYRDFHPESYGAPNGFPSNDIPPWYSLILGLLWKLTGSLLYSDIVVLQILIFSFLMIFVYQIGFLLFRDTQAALYSGVATLFFLPLVFHNIIVLRDIWPYYGIICVLLGILKYLVEESSPWWAVMGGVAFAICQLMRPPCFVTLLAINAMLIVLGFLHYFPFKRCLTLITLFFLTNGIFFWLPFMAYNKYAYDRYLINPAGQNLLTGLGEFSNQWGYKLQDEWYGEYMFKNYHLLQGTQEADEVAKQLFWNSVKENPSFYFLSIAKRLHRIILPALTWFSWLYNDAVYDAIESTKDRIYYLLAHLSDPRVLVDIIARHVYIRLYLLAGYVGMIALLLRRKYWMVMLLFSIIASSYVVIFSHVEHRYLVAQFGVFPFFVGYLMHWMKNGGKKYVD